MSGVGAKTKAYERALTTTACPVPVARNAVELFGQKLDSFATCGHTADQYEDYHLRSTERLEEATTVTGSEGVRRGLVNKSFVPNIFYRHT